MDKVIKVTGFCPVQNKDQAIEITYLDASTTTTTEYAKGTFSCQHNTKGDKCDSSKCPIYHSVK